MKSTAATFGLMTLSVLCLLQWSVVSGSTERERLFRDITKNYLKSVEPDNVVLNVGITIKCARQDKTNGELITSALKRQIWTDKRLSWKPNVYGGIESIRLPSDLVWLPDIKLYNSVGSWTYDTDILKLELVETGINLQNYQNSTCPLAVKSASAIIRTRLFPCCKAPFDIVEINVQLEPNTAGNEKHN